ncbi:hypothetical protein, partial [Kitasatospora sp. NPDC088351]|uniref:hypothetical protein n=1 Tax=Kitasatospora sp. NPDC088351 TaxID=3155180 RepID=UPI00343C31B4
GPVEEVEHDLDRALARTDHHHPQPLAGLAPQPGQSLSGHRPARRWRDRVQGAAGFRGFSQPVPGAQ